MKTSSVWINDYERLHFFSRLDGRGSLRDGLFYTRS